MVHGTETLKKLHNFKHSLCMFTVGDRTKLALGN